MKKFNRRKFLEYTSASIGGAMVFFVSCGGANERSGEANGSPNPQGGKSKVVKCLRPEWFSLKTKPDSAKTADLLNTTLKTLFECDPIRGLRNIFNAGEIVAIKVNCLSGSSMSTHPQLVWELVKLLIKAGLSEDNIIIWDRTDADLTRAGFKLNKGSGVKVYGVDSSGYSRQLLIHRSIGSYMANIVERCDKIINLPVLKDHGIVGVTLSLKNFFGAVHNPNKYHPNCGDPYVADLYSHPLIKDKAALTIIDGIIGQYEGGPPPQPQWQWNFGGLLAGTDPVALDRIGLEIIEAARAENGILPLKQASRYPNYLITAEKLGLGNFELENIEVVKG